MNASTPDVERLRIDRSESAVDAPRRWPWVVGAVALVVIAVLAWWALRPRGVEVRTVEVAVTGGLAGDGAITANGYVVARTKASVSAETQGRLAFLGVSEGSRVRRGEIIARLDNADSRAALAAAEAGAREAEVDLGQARRDLARARELRQRDLISDKNLEDATTAVAAAQAALEARRAEAALARAQLENTIVRAPFDGTVLTKNAEVGEIVAPASAGAGLTRTSIVTMADLSTLEVEVDVNEAYIARIDNGQPARITLDAYTDTSFAGRVRQVIPTADRQKATVQVKVSILDRDPRILPEMAARVDFVEGGAADPVTPRRLTLPTDAVVGRGESAFVWRVEDGRARRTPIQTGPERAGRVEVRGGLRGGETVVAEPPDGLADGDRLRVSTP